MPERSQVHSPAPAPAPVEEAPRLTTGFVERWLGCLEVALGHAADFPFARMRSLSGRVHRVCVPLLPYAHLAAGEAGKLVESTPDPAHTRVRHLSPLEAGAAKGLPVVSVIPLFAWRDATRFWDEAITSNLRKKIRKAQKDGYAVERSNAAAAADGFHQLFAATMHRHGTPPHPRKLLRAGLARCGGEVVTVRRAGETVVAYYVLHDAEVALFMWAGFNEGTDAGYASLLGEWEAIRAALDRGCRWFDLGRAPLGGPAWKHKQYWHPITFHATSAPPPDSDVYSKYAFASRLWRRLPSALARRLGPWVVSHLPDA